MPEREVLVVYSANNEEVDDDVLDAQQEADAKFAASPAGRQLAAQAKAQLGDLDDLVAEMFGALPEADPETQAGAPKPKRKRKR